MKQLKANSKVIDLNPTISIIILNVNALNTLVKTQKFSDWIKKQGLYIFYLQQTYIKCKYKIRLKVKELENIYIYIYTHTHIYTHTNLKKAEVYK